MTRRRLVARLAAGAALATLVLVVAAAPAGAHAQLIQTSPVGGEVLDTAPTEITVTFSEKVSTNADSLRLYDGSGARVALGAPTSSSGTVAAPVRASIDDGAYIVTWRVVSADGHPIQGSFTFQVGTASNATKPSVLGLADRLLSGREGDRGVGIVWGITRFLVFAATALVVGIAAACVFVTPRARTSRAARRTSEISWSVLLVASALGFLLQGPYDAGVGLGKMFDGALLDATLDTRFGVVWLVRIVVLFAALPVLSRLFRPGAPTLPQWWAPAAATIAVVLSAAPALSGHASTGRWIAPALVADTMHVAAMATWMGGLVVVAMVVLAGGVVVGTVPIERHAAVARFSRLAAWSVGALVVTGVFQSIRQVGSLDALRHTEYGRMLIVKISVFGLTLVAATFSREVVMRTRIRLGRVPVVAGAADDAGSAIAEADEAAGEERAELGRLRRAVFAEVGAGIAVLVVTALLVNAAPARGANVSSDGPTGVTLRAASVTVDVTAAPGVRGLNDLHVSTYTPAGAPKPVDELILSFSLRSRDIAPITVPLRQLGPGHYLSPGFDFPLAGTWKVIAKVRTGDFDQVTVTGQVTIR